MINNVSSVVVRNIEELSAAQENLGSSLVLPSPETTADAIDGMNAFYFRDSHGVRERPNAADRIRQLDQIETPSLVQRQEKAGLELMTTARAVATLFGNGNSLGLLDGPKDMRTDMLSRQGFAPHIPDIDLRKIITGMARREAECDPSPEAWLAVSAAALDVQISLYNAQASAEAAKLSEDSLTKARRGLMPYIKYLVKG